MRTTVQLAEEMGARLGRREVLLRCLPLAGIAFAGIALSGPARAQSPGGTRGARAPEAAVVELLDADRAFAAASARGRLVEGLTAMMRPDVIAPVPGRGLLDGLDAVRADLLRDTLNRTSRAEWAPVRGGISGDGQHGFTFGFMTVHRADGTTVPGKYLAYWVKDSGGWRVAAYRRSRRADGAVDATPLAPALPATIVPVARDAASLDRHRRSLMQAERDFAAEAQRTDLRAAFAAFGSADAMNMGGPAIPGFVIGNEAIAAAVSQGQPAQGSSLDWGPERALVASSGDLGITFGHIVPKAAPPAGQERPRIPFFTIWRRAGPGAPWRYVAE